jgi:hypothetical protein
MSTTYEMTIGVILNCICLDFMFVLISLKERRNFVPCKHMYFIYKTRMFCDNKTCDFSN